MILNIVICVNVVNWIHIVSINRTSFFLTSLNIKLYMNVVNWIHIVLINRTSF